MGQKPILLVAGEIWEDKDEYLKIIERLGLQNQVRLEDRYIPDEELPVFFSAADALVAPYINGTQSAAVGMALGFGLHMVVTDIVAAGIADENRQDVLVVPPRDSFQLASALRSFLDSPSLHDGQVSPAEPDWWRLIQTLEELRVER